MPDITATDLRRGVEASLRRLNVDYIDIHLLHEPTLERIPDLDDILATYADLKAKGLVRSFGVAGANAGASSVKVAMGGADAILQTGESEWVGECVPDITYGAISAGSQSFDAPPAASEGAALERIRQALSRRRSGVVLISSRSPDRVRRLAAGVLGA